MGKVTKKTLGFSNFHVTYPLPPNAHKQFPWPLPKKRRQCEFMGPGRGRIWELRKAEWEYLPTASPPTNATTESEDRVHGNTGQEVKRRNQAKERWRWESLLPKSFHSVHSASIPFFSMPRFFPSGRCVPPPISPGTPVQTRVGRSLALSELPKEVLRAPIIKQLRGTSSHYYRGRGH